ncbi:PREDICTED: uncharacterized protein LOC104814517 [Tarenaya hassleriana]|uniref:uncharacterized protein LOC104814517 n=1 Tax=Tarenaya hassleriana TaxID=28532 RepID=UPI00053C40DE|nr:PREDICTED: uncharacterized protein LOC104814517 [Tarenaya hassleriana]
MEGQYCPSSRLAFRGSRRLEMKNPKSQANSDTGQRFLGQDGVESRVCCFRIQMGANPSLSFALVALFVLCFVSGDSTAARPGLFYTRHRGRCTPQYWSSRREVWPRMVPERSTVEKVFGAMAKERWRSDLTLVESAARNDDDGNAYGALLKQGIAALLNSYARERFAYTPWQVKTMLIQAMVSEPAARRQARRFAMANEACD